MDIHIENNNGLCHREYFRILRTNRKLIQCFANTVTSNYCANLLLAAGASPVMADDIIGACEFAKKVDALTINIGTPLPYSSEAMAKALSIAKSRGIPTVLDPVGCGFVSSHTTLALSLLKEGVSILRCNQSEAKSLLGQTSHACGVDASPDDTVTEANLVEHKHNVLTLAQSFHCIAAVTGAIDVVAAPDGRVMVIRGGHPIMEQVTGAGCMLSALTGAFAACNPFDLFDAVVACLTIYADAGLRAYESLHADEGSGTFPIRLIDVIYHSIREENDYEQ